MNKTISINPDLFTFSSSKRKSRKKELKINSEIKVKPPVGETQKKRLLRKQNILRHLRKQQEDNYKQLMESNEIKPRVQTNERNSDFQSDFKESISYFKNLQETTPQHNHTSKVYHEISPHIKENVQASLEPMVQNDSFDITQNSDPVHLSKPIIHHASKPTWGCLKNGSLPTFRDWKRSTQKGGDVNELKKQQIMTNISKKKDVPQPKLKYRKQKKTIRRTYKVGRSKIFSKISVLVSNKTIRNNIMNKSQELKQLPIEDVRRYLIKQGFVRVGSSAPNDVLRKMYETTRLICGEVENHNTDNLLYNYMNDI